jgi:hypothetical protein
MKELLLRALVTWAIFVPFAFANGAIRDATYKPRVGDLAAHQISTVIAVVLFLLLSYITFSSYAQGASYAQLLVAGALMVFMTIVFEFGFGRFVRGFSWSYLLRDYNLAEGRVWSLFLLAMLLSPSIIRALQEAGSK